MTLFLLVILFLILIILEYKAESKFRSKYFNKRRHHVFKGHAFYRNELISTDSNDLVATESLVLRNESQLITMKRCETIHIGVVCSGYKSNLYFYTMLKSILYYRLNPLHFHILVNKFSENVLKTLFVSWDLPQISVNFYNLGDSIPDIRWVPNSHYSGVHGLVKLVFPKILPSNCTKIIILDTDLTFMSDIYELWQQFDNFNSEEMIGLVENESDFYLSKKSKTWPALDRGFNTGVILYKIVELKAFNWDKLWPRIAKKAALLYGATSLADQDIMNAVLKNHPYLVYKVPCNFNTQLSDKTRSNLCYNEKSVKIIHWNSPKKINVLNRDGAYFRSIYLTFHELSGNLVKRSLFQCASDNNDNNGKNQSFDKPVQDLCYNFNKANVTKWRTLLYFRNYDYIPVESDVTFIAQLSYDRIQMIEELSKHWEGPISLALYVSDPELQYVNNFIDNSDVLVERTNIAFNVIFKEGDYYPINYLRNVCLRTVNTPYVFLADIDFLPMIGLYQTIKFTLATMVSLQKKALIVPAFESQRYKSKFPKTKFELLQMWEQKTIFTFRYDVWSSGHAPTNYTRWRTAKQLYPVKWELDFEPYIIVRSDVIKYDTRFVGFGWNKVSHIMELACQDYEFLVMHNAFIIHKPHAPSYEIAMFRNSPIYRMCLQFLKEEFVIEMKQKYGKSFDNKKLSDESAPNLK